MSPVRLLTTTPIIPTSLTVAGAAAAVSQISTSHSTLLSILVGLGAAIPAYLIIARWAVTQINKHADEIKTVKEEAAAALVKARDEADAESQRMHRENLAEMNAIRRDHATQTQALAQKLDPMFYLMMGVQGTGGYIEEKQYVADSIHFLADYAHALGVWAEQIGDKGAIDCPFHPPTAPRPRRRRRRTDVDDG